jgi:hypothetical protein
MPLSRSGASASADPPVRGGVYRPLLYTALLIAVTVGAFVYDLRINGIFACSSGGYAPGRYLAYCNSGTYSDYDHGAFWFGLEPAATSAAKNADALFLGTSRMQFAFSSDATRRWFAERDAKFYLLGFSYSENVVFTRPLLDALEPKARVYVVNTDRFFETEETEPAADVIHGDAAESRHRRKQLWQTPHRVVCGSLAFLCGNQIAFVRTIVDGTWTLQGGEGLKPGRISAAPPRSEKQLAERVAVAEAFVAGLPVGRDCVLFTVAPTAATPWDEAAVIAAAVGVELFAPRIDDLQTFDDSHLDTPSAQRWSERFLAEAGHRIDDCLGHSKGGRAGAGDNAGASLGGLQ